MGMNASSEVMSHGAGIGGGRVNSRLGVCGGAATGALLAAPAAVANSAGESSNARKSKPSSASAHVVKGSDADRRWPLRASRASCACRLDAVVVTTISPTVDEFEFDRTSSRDLSSSRAKLETVMRPPLNNTADEGLLFSSRDLSRVNLRDGELNSPQPFRSMSSMSSNVIPLPGGNRSSNSSSFLLTQSPLSISTGMSKSGTANPPPPPVGAEKLRRCVFSGRWLGVLHCASTLI
mmetsp:Transcript_10184/g.35293  ORF Transcript_10184/g.35293 Transcript_10184/m.35293 type:complete len:236 (+) Transcript_10184:570-1277(+)